jgi:cytochrome c peroxidase
MGGPVVPWRPGRTDDADASKTPENGRLPDAHLGASHIRDVFVTRMGFTEKETVALIGGGHAVGRAHAEDSGFVGPWTSTPDVFTNHFFGLLLHPDAYTFMDYAANSSREGQWESLTRLHNVPLMVSCSFR